MQEEDFGTSWKRRKSGSGPAKARRIRTNEKVLWRKRLYP
jgi:hypothetical protein